MLNRSQIFKTTKELLRMAKADGQPVMFVVNSTRRKGWVYQGHYLWESGDAVLITSHVEKVIDPMNPE